MSDWLPIGPGMEGRCDDPFWAPLYEWARFEDGQLQWSAWSTLGEWLPPNGDAGQQPTHYRPTPADESAIAHPADRRLHPARARAIGREESHPRLLWGKPLVKLGPLEIFFRL